MPWSCLLYGRPATWWVEMFNRTGRREKVLRALTGHPWLTAVDICRATGLIWIYPALMDLEGEGLIIARWEPTPWPRRRIYALASEVTLGEHYH